MTKLAKRKGRSEEKFSATATSAPMPFRLRLKGRHAAYAYVILFNPRGLEIEPKEKKNRRAGELKFMGKKILDSRKSRKHFSPGRIIPNLDISRKSINRYIHIPFLGIIGLVQMIY